MVSDRSATTLHVVLDHQHGAVLGDGADQLRRSARCPPGPARPSARRAASSRARARAWSRSPARACGRRTARPPAGRRRRARPTCLEQLVGARVRARRARVAQRQKAKEFRRLRCSATRTFSRTDQMRKHRRDLEGPRQPHAGDRRRRAAGDVATVEVDAAGGRRQEVGQQVEAGRLAGAVRADQGMDRVAATRSFTFFTATKPLNSLVSPWASELFLVPPSPPHAPRQIEASSSPACSCSHEESKPRAGLKP